MYNKRILSVTLIVCSVFLVAYGNLIGDFFRIHTSSTEEEIHPVLAYNDSRGEYLAVWYNDRPGNDDIRAQRITKNRAQVGSAFYISAGPGADRRYPDVVYNSQHDEYLVVWEHYDGMWYNIYGRRVSGTGQVLGVADIVIASGSNIATHTKPAVSYAFTADKYLVVWQEAFHPSVTTNILGQVVNSSGALDGGNFSISDDPVGEPRREPDVAYNRSRNEYLVVFQLEAGDNDIYARRVTGGGMPLQPPTIEIGRFTSQEVAPAVAAIPTAQNQGQYLVVWEAQFSPTDGDIFGRLVEGEGMTPQPAFAITASNVNQYQPAVAGNETAREYLVVWMQESSVTSTDIVGRNLSMTGGFPGPERQVDGTWSIPDHVSVAGGWHGDFLVAWDDAWLFPRGIFGQLWGVRGYLPMVLRRVP